MTAPLASGPGRPREVVSEPEARLFVRSAVLVVERSTKVGSRHLQCDGATVFVIAALTAFDDQSVDACIERAEYRLDRQPTCFLLASKLEANGDHLRSDRQPAELDEELAAALIAFVNEVKTPLTGEEKRPKSTSNHLDVARTHFYRRDEVERAATALVDERVHRPSIREGGDRMRLRSECLGHGESCPSAAQLPAAGGNAVTRSPLRLGGLA